MSKSRAHHTSCWKTLVYLKLIGFLHTLIAYDPPNGGNRKCLFIYKYMGKQFPFIFLKNSVTNKKSLIHSSIAHKIHSFYFDSQYELLLNNKHLSYNGQSGGFAIWQSFFKKENPNFKRQSVYKGNCILKMLLHWILEDWMSSPLQHDL